MSIVGGSATSIVGGSGVVTEVVGGRHTVASITAAFPGRAVIDVTPGGPLPWVEHWSVLSARW